MSKAVALLFIVAGDEVRRMWWIVGAAVALWVLRHLWRSWNHPSKVLCRQAVHMGWLVAEVKRHRNTRLSRHGMVSVVWYRDCDVQLLSPPYPHRFKDYVELERWLAKPEAKLLLDFVEVDAEALRADNKPIEHELGTEARYFQEVDDAIHMMGDRGTLAIYSQLNLDFMKVSMEVREFGFECDVPPRLVAGFIAEGAEYYRSNPKLGIQWLEQTRSNIPRLWPEVTEPTLQKQLVQLLDKKGKT